MKGRRKLKTSKWFEIERHSKEAKAILRRKKDKGELLDTAAHLGPDLEPLGWLAGGSDSAVR